MKTIKICYSDCVKGGEEGKKFEAQDRERNRTLTVTAWYNHSDLPPGPSVYIEYGFDLSGRETADLIETSKPGDKPWTWTSPCNKFQVIFEVK
jgi:hypothetical protein